MGKGKEEEVCVCAEVACVHVYINVYMACVHACMYGMCSFVYIYVCMA